MIDRKCLETGVYPSAWKKSNVVPIHKKESRQLKKNYRPISLLPIFGKLLEKLIFDAIQGRTNHRARAQGAHNQLGAPNFLRDF